MMLEIRFGNSDKSYSVKMKSVTKDAKKSKLMRKNQNKDLKVDTGSNKKNKKTIH